MLQGRGQGIKCIRSSKLRLVIAATFLLGGDTGSLSPGRRVFLGELVQTVEKEEPGFGFRLGARDETPGSET